MKKLLPLILLLILSCEEVLDPDTTAPTVVITYPVNESTLTATTTIKADVADNSDIVSVNFLIDGSKAYTDTLSPYEYEWDVCILGTGSHTVLVKAEDSSGNKGQSDISTFTINASYDCASVCGGDKLIDNCEVCDADTTNDCTADCNGDWGGTAVLDDCGVCNNYDTQPIFPYGTCDCAGTSNGTATTDNCGTCDADSTNDCTADCNGDFGGDAVLDECGTCDNDSTNDCQFVTIELSSLVDELFRGIQFDITGASVVGYEEVTGFATELNAISENHYRFLLFSIEGQPLNDLTLIFIVVGSTENFCISDVILADVNGISIELQEDSIECLNISIPNIDCAGTPNGTATTDNCNTCAGGTTGLTACVQDCADVWGGTSWVSDCGCVSADNSGDDCDDCEGTPNGTAYQDDCGLCHTDVINDCLWNGDSSKMPKNSIHITNDGEVLWKTTKCVTRFSFHVGGATIINAPSTIGEINITTSGNFIEGIANNWYLSNEPSSLCGDNMWLELNLDGNPTHLYDIIFYEDNQQTFPVMYYVGIYIDPSWDD